MKLEELTTPEHLSQFLNGTQAVIFTVNTVKRERYKWIQHELIRFNYMTLKRSEKGIVIRYLIKVSQYSRQQITRLIRQYCLSGYVTYNPARSNGFKGKYTAADIRLIAGMDERYDKPCGQAIKKLCERAYRVFDEIEYQRLSSISSSHIYNLRKSKTYSNTKRYFEKTRPKKSNIGERRKPAPEGKPGYIRIDTVHQGDQGKVKGLYHINAVDEVTQFEVVCSVEKISEAYLIPALEYMLSFFPFKVLGFHSDNGSEYINKRVARLLKKLFIEFTKSRPRHCNDNALAESKNASIIRKTLGYIHIPQKYASQVNEFNMTYLNPHINFHRPCFFPVITIDEKGRERKKYPYKNMMTPYDKLKSLADIEHYLKDGITIEKMDKDAYKISDNQSADQLQEARQLLFKTIGERLFNQK